VRTLLLRVSSTSSGSVSPILAPVLAGSDSRNKTGSIIDRSSLEAVACMFTRNAFDPVARVASHISAMSSNNGKGFFRNGAAFGWFYSSLSIVLKGPTKTYILQYMHPILHQLQSPSFSHHPNQIRTILVTPSRFYSRF
jgi:hypothetical protein